MFFKLAARDVGILAIAALAWKATAHWTAGDTAWADLFGVVLGLLVGASGYVLHEWGHFLGALATQSRVEAPAHLTTVFLFSFDSRRNDLRQFLVMSFSGFAATALVVWGCYTLLPDDWLATRVARGTVLLGAALTVLVELPLVAYAMLGRGLPPVENGAHARRTASESA